MTAHGGKRAGSGRPRSPDPGRLIAIRLTADELRLLATIAPSVSEAIHLLLAARDGSGIMHRHRRVTL